MSDDGMVPLICPTCKKISSNRSKPPATLHGVVFDILVWGRWQCGPPSPDGLRRGSLRYDVACRAVAREASEGWWACLDSNQEPDRYERPALTIELQAPPQAGRSRGQSTVLETPYNAARDPAMPRRQWAAIRAASLDRNTGEFHHLAPFLCLIGDQFAEFRRRHRLWNAANLSQPRHQLGILERLANRLVERGDDFRRRALWRRDAIESNRLESRHRFGDGGYIRHAGPALRRGDAQRAHAAAARLFQRRGQVVEDQLHLVGNDIGKRQCRPAIRH